MKILIVDDSKTMRQILRNVLNKLGYDNTDIIEAADGQEGWDAVNEHGDFDIVLTDWNMPIINGLDLVKKIRGEDKYARLPIIMITTEGGKGEVITALKAGVNNYIVKPFEPSVLKAKLNSVFNVS